MITQPVNPAKGRGRFRGGSNPAPGRFSMEENTMDFAILIGKIFWGAIVSLGMILLVIILETTWNAIGHYLKVRRIQRRIKLLGFRDPTGVKIIDDGINSELAGNAAAGFDTSGNRCIKISKSLYESLTISEFNFVISHEIAHFINGDCRDDEEHRRLADANLFVRAILLPGIRKRHTEKERRADIKALELLQAAGLPMHGGVAFVQRSVEEESKLWFIDRLWNSIYHTYPLSSKRVAYLAAEIKRLENSGITKKHDLA